MISSLDLKKLDKERQKFKLEAFNNILIQISNKIKESSFMLAQNYCIFQVPEFMFGFSVYNVDECCEWIIEQLKKQGFTNVSLLEHNILVIKWI